ncbi:MAG: TetR/AcrR family transcriptional regulator [Ruminococcaceae bacterium]|nr:TetR/AcrR family transcriptional regulator [Oscillospiraceae bacterium]
MRISKPPQERRAELVAAARVLFDKKGVDKTRVSDIVARVGVAQGVFYYYFASKAEVVQVVADQVREEISLRAEAILADTAAPFGRRLADYIEMYIDLVDQFLGDDETSLTPLKGRELEERYHLADSAGPLMACLEKLISSGVANGDVTAAYPRPTARILLYGLRELAAERLPARRLIYTVAEQGLGLGKGTLTQYLPK